MQRVTACLSIPAVQTLLHVREIPGRSNARVEEPEQVERDTTSQNKEAEKLEFEAWPNLGN